MYKYRPTVCQCMHFHYINIMQHLNDSEQFHDTKVALIGTAYRTLFKNKNIVFTNDTNFVYLDLKC